MKFKLSKKRLITNSLSGGQDVHKFHYLHTESVEIRVTIDHSSERRHRASIGTSPTSPFELVLQIKSKKNLRFSSEAFDIQRSKKFTNTALPHLYVRNTTT